MSWSSSSYHHHLAAVAEISPIILHQTVLFAMATGRPSWSTSIPVSLEMVSGKLSFLPVEAFQRRMSDMISPLARNACPANWADSTHYKVFNIRGWSKSTGGGVGRRKWKPGSSKKHDPPPRSGTKFWWPTPDIGLKKTWPTPITQLRVLHFFITFSLYICSIEYHIQHKTCTPILISKNGQYSYVLVTSRCSLKFQWI